MKRLIIVILALFYLSGISSSQTSNDRINSSYSKLNIHCGIGAFCGIPLFFAGFNYRPNKSFSMDFEIIENAHFIFDDCILGVNYHFKPSSGFICGLNYSNVNAGNEHLYSISPHIGYILYDPEYLPSLKFAVGYGPAYFKVDGGRSNIYYVLNLQLVVGFQFFKKSL